MQIIGITFPFIILIYHTLNIYQQSHYDFLKLINTYKKLYISKIYMYILYIMLVISVFSFKYCNIIIFILGLVSLLFRGKYIIKLKFTNRIIRLIITTILVYSLLLYLSYSNILFIMLVIIYPFIIYLINLINYPIEYLINYYYILKAKKKLKQNKNLIKIAITGSFGKTTIKNIINEILKTKYITLSTPKSYNTLLGITKTINESLNNSTEVLIVEMGANHIGEINKMKKLIDPDISIISDIGKQHMSTFKTISNVLKAKLEIINFNKESSITIINNDNIYLKHLIVKNKLVYRVGINKNKDIYASNIKVKENFTSFNIIDNIYQNKLLVSTRLLGEHNVNNILIAYLTSKILGVEDNSIISTLDKIEPVENRLKYKKINNIHIYDDSYNSNIVGFKNAIKVLLNTNTLKVIITPGIVDGGIMSKEINEEIAHILNKSNIDEIYLINNSEIKYYKNILKKYILFNSFKDAYNHFLNTYTLEEVSLLIENDLPDSYYEGWLNETR